MIGMDEKLWRQAQDLASQNYLIVVSPEETTSGQFLYLAKNLELPGCMAQGNSKEEAISNLDEARIDYIYSLLKDNLEIPKPAPQPAQTITLKTSFTIEEKQSYIIDQISFTPSKNVTKPANTDRLIYDVSVKA
jgi:predicted RNase H-like HicB family nuclease